MQTLIPAAKTINTKYFKGITNTKKNWPQKFNLPSIDRLHAISPLQYLEQFNFRISLFQQSNMSFFQQNKLSQSIFNDQKFPSYSINKQSITQSQPNEEKLSQLLTKKINKQFVNVQTLYFQSNVHIEDKIICKDLRSIEALSVSIFDGHGGSILAEYASKRVNQLIDQYIISSPTRQTNRQEKVDLIKSAIQYAYDRIQQNFFQIMQNQIKTGNKQIFKTGSCALTLIIFKDQIVVANSGDSQAIIISQQNNNLTFFPLNQQHNTSNPNEIQRIQQITQDKSLLIKSKINNDLYIKGMLHPTRTLGDYYLKKQKYFRKISHSKFQGPYVIHKPQFNIFPILTSFKYLLIASDGLWDFLNKKQILKVVQDFQKNQCLQNQQHLLQVDLLKTYRQEPLQNKNTLSQLLKDRVLNKCGEKHNKTKKQLIQMKPGQRRNYCDDISIVVISFRQTNQ